MGRKKRQTRLTFEPAPSTAAVGNPSPHGTGLSPANVRFSDSITVNGNSGSPTRSSPLSKSVTRSRRRTAAQTKLHNAFTHRRTPPRSQAAPTASFMRQTQGSSQRGRAIDSSEESAAEVDRPGREDSEDDDSGDMSAPPPKSTHDDEKSSVESSPSSPLPTPRNPRSSQSVSTKLRGTILSDDEEDSDDDVPIVPSSALRRKRPTLIELEDSDTDGVVASPKKRRRIGPNSSQPEDRSKDDEIKTLKSGGGRLKLRAQMVSSPTHRPRHKGHRSEKEKKKELLRRRRAGEKIDRLTSSESDSDEGRRGIYDSGSDDGLVALKEFDDEDDQGDGQKGEEDEGSDGAELIETEKAGPNKAAANHEDDSGDEDEDEDRMDDFVVEDDDGPMGAPENLGIPLQFTAQASKPLKEQFPFVVEWLVHNRINPAFDRKDEIYTNAWRRLDDEFRGLANSKFTSSVWKPDFYRSLKARPKIDTYELDRIGGIDLYDNCMACGRSGHPSTRRVIFAGHPYHSDTLVEKEPDSSEEDEEDEEDRWSVNSAGQKLEPKSKEWFLGATCCSNAETAHGLFHWKYALKEWVEDRLDAEGWMHPEKLSEREYMKARKRRDLANGIADDWQSEGTIAALYRDFKTTLENARNKDTTNRRGRWR